MFIARLCRLMCGKSPTFRSRPPSFPLGATPFLSALDNFGHSPHWILSTARKATGLPHIRRHSRDREPAVLRIKSADSIIPTCLY